MSQIRADHIGSLQRPAALLTEIHHIYEAGHTALLASERAKDLTHLHELEDAAIDHVIRRQEEVGLEAVTDGEFRRISYFNSFFDAVAGVEPSQNKLHFRDDSGDVVEHEGPVAIAGRLKQIDSPSAREVAYVRERTDRDVKVTFPTASFVYAQAVLGPAVRNGAYASLEEASDDLIAIERQLVDDAIAAGATYLQFDVSGYMMLKASGLTGFLASQGHDVDAILDRMLELDRRVVDGLPDHVTTCLHQCRGNYASRYLAENDGLGELGETLFSLPYDRFTLEWDDYVERGPADYAALAGVAQPGPTVVLGVVSTRHAQMETPDDILRKVEAAAQHIPIEQLAISPQCGFSSALTTGDDDRPDGNLIDDETQWRKLELLVATAERIWD
jgi:5-methyltetrahydropteroyltriglutamate--homocysteine methyltransferase